MRVVQRYGFIVLALSMAACETDEVSGNIVDVMAPMLRSSSLS